MSKNKPKISKEAMDAVRAKVEHLTEGWHPQDQRREERWLDTFEVVDIQAEALKWSMTPRCFIPGECEPEEGRKILVFDNRNPIWKEVVVSASLLQSFRRYDGILHWLYAPEILEDPR